MSNSSKTRFFLLNILLTLLLPHANLGISMFQGARAKTPKTKYVNSQRILAPMNKEVQKTAYEMLEPRFKELKVLSEQIKNLEQKKGAKGYLSSAEKKELEEKKKQGTSLVNSINREYEQQVTRMLQSKVSKVNEVLTKISKKHNYTILPTQISAIKTAIAEDDDVTDLVLTELGLATQEDS